MGQIKGMIVCRGEFTRPFALDIEDRIDGPHLRAAFAQIGREVSVSLKLYDMDNPETAPIPEPSIQEEEKVKRMGTPPPATPPAPPQKTFVPTREQPVLVDDVPFTYGIVED